MTASRNGYNAAGDAYEVDAIGVDESYSGSADQSEPYVRGITNVHSEYFLLLFMLMSCGYMLPWTSLGSLITHYKQTYSASFYVKLYCAYYLPGLPIAVLQYRYDVYLDLKYGSQNTYLFRGVISFAIMMCILVSLVWLKSKSALILLFVALGICGWLCHGTASMLASMYPSQAIAYLQTGFRCPEIYTVIAVSALHLGKDATIPNLNIFYIMTACIVLVGAISWTIVVLDEKSKDFFDIKDNQVYAADISERLPLLGNNVGINHDEEEKLKKMEREERVIVDVTTDIESDDSSIVTTRLRRNSNTGIYRSNDSLVQKEDNQSGRINENHMADTAHQIQNNKTEKTERIEEEKIKEIPQEKENTFSRFSSYANPLARTRYLLLSVERAAMQLQLRPDDEYALNDEIFQRMFLLCLALFVIIWCSIFQAAFFAYVTSSDNREIEQILYFVRLFADLIGRPLTRLPRPFFLKTKSQLLVAAVLRTKLMIVFFLYILVPSLPRSDAFVITLVAVFSVMSGYFTVLIYEYAAADLEKSAQTAATRLLNICFQCACFTAVLMSLLITSLGWSDSLAPADNDLTF